MMNTDASGRMRIVNVLRHDANPMGQSATSGSRWARSTRSRPTRPAAATAATTAFFATLRPRERGFLRERRNRTIVSLNVYASQLGMLAFAFFCKDSIFETDLETARHSNDDWKNNIYVQFHVFYLKIISRSFRFAILSRPDVSSLIANLFTSTNRLCSVVGRAQLLKICDISNTREGEREKEKNKEFCASRFQGR